MLHSPEIEPIDDIVVVKVGTSTLVNRAEDGTERFDDDSFRRIGRQIMNLENKGEHVILVTSGGITAGMLQTGTTTRPNRDTHMTELQRLASVGWLPLFNKWSKALPERITGSLLLTGTELNMASERQEALTTTHQHLRHGDIPIVNENDAISHAEIQFGDNDTLAALFAARIRTSSLFGDNVRLVMLSDIEGVYADPSDPSSLISEISDPGRFRHIAGPSSSSYGTGGMESKFNAAIKAINYGVPMFLGNGRQEDVIQRLLDRETGTQFMAATKVETLR